MFEAATNFVTGKATELLGILCAILLVLVVLLLFMHKLDRSELKTARAAEATLEVENSRLADASAAYVADGQTREAKGRAAVAALAPQSAVTQQTIARIQAAKPSTNPAACDTPKEVMEAGL